MTTSSFCPNEGSLLTEFSKNLKNQTDSKMRQTQSYFMQEPNIFNLSYSDTPCGDGFEVCAWSRFSGLPNTAHSSVEMITTQNFRQKLLKTVFKYRSLKSLVAGL